MFLLLPQPPFNVVPAATLRSSLSEELQLFRRRAQLFHQATRASRKPLSCETVIYLAKLRKRPVKCLPGLDSTSNSPGACCWSALVARSLMQLHAQLLASQTASRSHSQPIQLSGTHQLVGKLHRVKVRLGVGVGVEEVSHLEEEQSSAACCSLTALDLLCFASSKQRKKPLPVRPI